MVAEEFNNEGAITGNGSIGGNVGWNNGAMSGNCINEGKKLIVADAVSTTDIEQIALAIHKSEISF